MSPVVDMARQLETSPGRYDVLPGLGASCGHLPPTPPTTPPTTTLPTTTPPSTTPPTTTPSTTTPPSTTPPTRTPSTTTPPIARTPYVWTGASNRIISPPLRELSNSIYEIINDCMTGTGPSSNARIRVMHVTAEEAQTGGWGQNYAPNVDQEDAAAQRIALAFRFYAADYTAEKSHHRSSTMNAEFSDLSWAFWKPILAYAMMLRQDKKYLVTRLVQVLHCLCAYAPPEQLGKGFYKHLHGLEAAWATFEFYSPLFPGEHESITRLGQQRYREVKEIWPIRIRNQRLVAWWWKDRHLPSGSVPSFPINYNTQSDTLSDTPIPTTPPQLYPYPRSPRVDQSTLSHTNWRNLNDFLATLYVVKCKNVESGSDLLNPNRSAGWWLWNGLFALIEGVETEQLDMDRNDNAKAVAYIWMTRHALRLRQADFAPTIRWYGDQYHEPTRYWFRNYGHEEGRSPAAIGNLFNIEKIRWGKLMSKRWDLWWDILHELQARVPGDFEYTKQCWTCWGYVEGATVRSKLINGLYATFKALRANLHAQELLKEEQPELEAMLNGEAPDPIGRWDWKKDITATYDKERAEAAKNNNANYRDLEQIRQHFRERITRIHAEQEKLYPVYEENALRREFMQFENGQWIPTKDAEVKAAINSLAWQRTYLRPLFPQDEIKYIADRLGVVRKDGDEIADIVERYLTRKYENQVEALLMFPMERDGSEGYQLRRVRGGRSHKKGGKK